VKQQRLLSHLTRRIRDDAQRTHLGNHCWAGNDRAHSLQRNFHQTGPHSLGNSPSSGAIAGTSGAAEWFACSVGGSTLTGSWVCNRHRWWQTWAVESSCWSLTRSSANSIAHPCNHHFAKNTATTKRQTSFIQRTTSGVNYFFYQKQFFVIYKSFLVFLVLHDGLYLN
jgi:hypothetical protein